LSPFPFFPFARFYDLVGASFFDPSSLFRSFPLFVFFTGRFPPSEDIPLFEPPLGSFSSPPTPVAAVGIPFFATGNLPSDFWGSLLERPGCCFQRFFSCRSSVRTFPINVSDIHVLPSTQLRFLTYRRTLFFFGQYSVPLPRSFPCRASQKAGKRSSVGFNFLIERRSNPRCLCPHLIVSHLLAETPFLPSPFISVGSFPDFLVFSFFSIFSISFFLRVLFENFLYPCAPPHLRLFAPSPPTSGPVRTPPSFTSKVVLVSAHYKLAFQMS